MFTVVDKWLALAKARTERGLWFFYSFFDFKISCCESITDGLFAQEITIIASISKYFSGGFITYTNESKINVVKVKQDIIEKYGAISEKCAVEMALNTQKIFKTNVAVSFTCNSGPSSTETKPVGLVYIGVAINDKIWCETLKLSGDKSSIRAIVVEQAITILKKILLNFQN